MRSRSLHLLGSQVSLAVRAKHRSSSRMLNHVVRQVGGLELCYGLYLNFNHKLEIIYIYLYIIKVFILSRWKL